jgi:hypothetical protein
MNEPMPSYSAHPPGFVQYLTRVVNTYDTHYPVLRWGQAYFNVLVEMAPNLAMLVRRDADRLDPFYDDTKLDDFVAFVQERWGMYD